MANTTANVLVGSPLVTGGLYVGPLVETADYPDDATSSLPVGLEAAGYIGEDGVTEANERSTERIMAWGGDTTRIVQTEHTLTYSFVFIESKNATVLQAVYGEDNVTTDGNGNITVKKNKAVLPRQSFCFEMRDGDTHIRNFVPVGQITETGEVSFVHSDSIRYEVTVEAFPDSNDDKALMFLGEPGTGV